MSNEIHLCTYYNQQVKPYDVNKWLVDIRFKFNVLKTQRLTF
jgi:hypothetical protein